MNLMTQGEYAEHAGVSRQTVVNWVSSGKLTPDCFGKEKGEDGRVRKKIIPEKADMAVADNLNKLKKREKKGGGRPDLVAKSRKKIEAAEKVVGTDSDPDGMPKLKHVLLKKEILRTGILELAFLKQKKELVYRQEFESKILEIHRKIKTDLQALPRKSHIVAELAALDTPAAVAKRLDQIVYDTLIELSAEVERIEKEQGIE